MPDSEEPELEKIRQLVREDGRYPFEAYIFVYQALEYTTTKLVGEKRHVSGRELLDGIRRFAIDAFGPLALMVFKHWGVRKTEDWGEMVWSLVQRELMGKTAEDRKEDFADGYAFEDAFSPERLLPETLNARELAPPAHSNHRELPRAARATGGTTL
ncbi:hypothetical protein HY251_16930 [bacterium]|nr:hypothetical protein [bacterium]